MNPPFAIPEPRALANLCTRRYRCIEEKIVHCVDEPRQNRNMMNIEPVPCPVQVYSSDHRLLPSIGTTIGRRQSWSRRTHRPPLNGAWALLAQGMLMSQRRDPGESSI